VRLALFDDYRLGVVDGDEIRDVSEAVPERGAEWPWPWPWVPRLVAAFAEARPTLEAVARRAQPRQLASVGLHTLSYVFGYTCLMDLTLRQDGTRREMVYSVAELLAYASTVMPLSPGDVLASGTPAGVEPIEPGDRVGLEIEPIGRLAIDVRPPPPHTPIGEPGSRRGVVPEVAA